MSTPSFRQDDREGSAPGRADCVPDPRGDIPHVLLEFAASLLADSVKVRLVWLVGPPGCGKSTLLRAFRTLDGSMQTLELSREIKEAGHSEGPPRPGGLRLLGEAAIRLRTSGDRASTRLVVATTGLPVDAVPCVPNERLLLLLVQPDRVALQIQSRPPRAARTADPEEMPMHWRNFQRIARLPHARLVVPPFCPELIGRDETHDSQRCSRRLTNPEEAG